MNVTTLGIDIAKNSFHIYGVNDQYGITIPLGINHVMSEVPIILKDDNNGLTSSGKELFYDMLMELKNVDAKVKWYNQKIEDICESNFICKLLCKLPGIGALTATAIVALVGDIGLFKNGRDLLSKLTTYAQEI